MLQAQRKPTFPSIQWHNSFESTEQGTQVKVKMDFTKGEELEQLVKMGFKEGFTAAHQNLDELFAMHFKSVN